MLVYLTLYLYEPEHTMGGELMKKPAKEAQREKVFKNN